MKFRFSFTLNAHFTAWYLTPSLRFRVGRNGGFLAITFLKADACLMWV